MSYRFYGEVSLVYGGIRFRPFDFGVEDGVAPQEVGVAEGDGEAVVAPVDVEEPRGETLVLVLAETLVVGVIDAVVVGVLLEVVYVRVQSVDDAAVDPHQRLGSAHALPEEEESVVGFDESGELGTVGGSPDVPARVVPLRDFAGAAVSVDETGLGNVFLAGVDGLVVALELVHLKEDETMKKCRVKIAGEAVPYR
jgi:hypothetical protein